jgi:hypothetical protein
MKCFDYAGSGPVFDDAGFNLAAGFAGPDILFPLVWCSAKKLTAFRFSDVLALRDQDIDLPATSKRRINTTQKTSTR